MRTWEKTYKAKFWRPVLSLLAAFMITGCSAEESTPPTGQPEAKREQTAPAKDPKETSFFSSLFSWASDDASSGSTASNNQTPFVPSETQPEEGSLFEGLFPWNSEPEKEEPKSPEPSTETNPAALKSSADQNNHEDWNLLDWAFSLFQPSVDLASLEEDPSVTADENHLRHLKVQQFIRSKLLNTKTIYVQSFTGENLDQVRVGLYEAIRKQGRLKLEEILPDDTKNMAVLRIHVDDFAIWDQTETFDQQNLAQYEEKALEVVPEKIIRRNALVGVQLSLFDAETGIPLVRGRYSQPFQQIYAGKAIINMPRENVEMERLTQILISKILRAFNSKNTSRFETLDLERGTNWGWFADNVHDSGDARIKKGIKMASSGHFDEAISLWKLVLYSPLPDEPKAIYRLNRASAFYNLGVVYQMQGDHLFAAKMFSQANRLKQTLRYAQAWGDNMHAWIDEENKQVRTVDLDIELPEERNKVVVVQKKKADVILLLETNPSLLLNAQHLWPLEPVVKNASPTELNGTIRTKLDRAGTRFDRKGYIDYGSEGQDAYPLPQRITPTEQIPEKQPKNQGFIRSNE